MSLSLLCMRRFVFSFCCCALLYLVPLLVHKVEVSGKRMACSNACVRCYVLAVYLNGYMLCAVYVMVSFITINIS